MAHEIRVPRLGWSMEVGVFLGWLKQDGEFVREGEMLYELEGEKAAQEIESIESGILRIASDAPGRGMEIPVGALLGYLVAAGEAIPSNNEASLADSSRQGTAVIEAHATQGLQVDAGAPAVSPPSSPSARKRALELDVPLACVSGSGPRGRVTRQDVENYAATGTARGTDHGAIEAKHKNATPRARRIARETGVDWRTLKGSGRHGRIREVDVRLAASASGSVPKGLGIGEGIVLPITKMRRVISQRMVASRDSTVPVTLTTLVDASKLVFVRNQLKRLSELNAPGYNDMLMKIVGEQLLRHPLLAGRWEGERIVVPDQRGVHIGLAVDTEDGLLVPVIREVPQKSLSQITQTANDLAHRARAGLLSLNELQGGVFTISNLGGFGIDAFTPVINLPESAILGVGAIRREPVVTATDQIVIGHRMTLSLTFDHRVNDGAPAARFLADVRSAIENISLELLALAHGDLSQK